MARNLDVWLDTGLTFDDHIICKTCYFFIRKLAHIRRYLTPQSAALIATSLIASRLDYCNAIFYGISASNISKMQKVQNSLARVVRHLPFKSHVTPTLMQLHWLPIKQRIDYKIALLSFKSLHECAPVYLSSLVSYRHSTTTRAGLRNQGKLIFRVYTHVLASVPFCMLHLTSGTVCLLLSPQLRHLLFLNLDLKLICLK